MPRRAIFTALLLSFSSAVVGVRAEESPGEEAIREAITVLEARKAQVEKKEDKDKIAKAIVELEKLVPAKKAADPKADDLGKLLTPSLLKKKFAGKAAFNPKTGELTLVYDFSAKEQLKDFEVGDSKPGLAKGVLTVGPGENVRQVVRFKTLTVTGQVQIGSLSGRHFKTSEKLWVGGSDKDIYILNENSSKEAEKYVSAAFTPTKALTSFEFSVSPVRLALRIGEARIGLATKTTSAGQLELLGGNSGGNSYGKLVLQGQIDPEWAKEFFKE
jgi:hypothetical protein